MVTWEVTYTRSAAADAELLRRAGLDKKAKTLLELIKQDPYRVPPPCEKLQGDLKGKFSRRINLKHRLVYEVVPDSHKVVVIWMFRHYRD